jgi:hypothetical protein
MTGKAITPAMAVVAIITGCLIDASKLHGSPSWGERLDSRDVDNATH